MRGPKKNWRGYKSLVASRRLARLGPQPLASHSFGEAGRASRSLHVRSQHQMLVNHLLAPRPTLTIFQILFYLLPPSAFANLRPLLFLTSNSIKMRKNRFSIFVMALSSILILASCKSGKDKEKESSATDTTGKAKEEMPRPPGKRVMVIHKVADYNKWLTAYEAHDSARVANGIHKYVIGRQWPDSNTVVAVMFIDDVDKAKAMTSSSQLKEIMKAAGVISEPKFYFTQDVFVDSSQLDNPLRLIIRHHVKDFDAWKKVFDSDHQARVDAGLTDRVVSRDLDDMNMVSLSFAVGDKQKAEAFGKSKALQDKMKEAGVDDKGEQFYFNIVKKY